MSNYVNLHSHTYYSTLDGLNSPKEYLSRAKELGMSHMAITDHGTLSGLRDFQRNAKEIGVIPILGMEGYVSETDRFDKRAKSKRDDGTATYNHITLLAQNEVGLENLSRLSEDAWTSGFYNKPRTDTDFIAKNNDGLIVLSGCMSGLVAKAHLTGDDERAYKLAATYKEILGDRYYIEVMSTNEPELNHFLLELADKLGIPPVMTTDCHYAKKEDLWVEDAMLILSTNPKKNRKFDLSKAKSMDFLERYNYLYPDRTMTFEKIEVYLRDYQTEVEKFQSQGIHRTDIYENTYRIAGTVGEYPYFEGLDLLPVPDDADPQVKLERKVRHEMQKKGLDTKPEYVERINQELDIIKQKDFATYFLIVEDSVSWAKRNGIFVGPGRGSAAGSLVCYALGITNVDPIKYGLLFFRFIDPSRDDFPDIDVDFAAHRREEVKAYVRRKYGHVASIATYAFYRGKGSIKAAARVLGIEPAEVNRATKDNDAPSDDVFFEYFLSSKKGQEFNRKHPEVLKLARELHGRIASRGVHAAGLVVSKEPIEKYAPIETGKNPSDENGPRIQYVALDMEECANIGLIKMDFLGLKALSIIQHTLEFIAANQRKVIDLDSIPLDDKNVYGMISEGYTKGMFQLEAVPYTNLILKMGGVWSFEELAASNALVRPGAMNTIGADYIARKAGKQMIEYPHSDSKWFLEETYGEVIYQEQVMLAMTELAGMSMQDANKVRKIIGKKRDPAEFEAYREAFVEGASKKIKRTHAERLWKDFEAHAGYSFNKSHAVAYSVLSYVTAWLKYYYPLEFMAATLRNEKDKDMITDYLIETKRLGIKVLLPHVNKSRPNISIDDGGIRLGLTNIKYVGDSVAAAVVRSRPFHSYQHLVEAVDTRGSGLNRRMLDSMNKVGAAVFADNPKRGDERDHFYEYLKIPAFEVKDLEPRVKVKFRPLDEYEEKGVFPVLAMVRGIKRGDGWMRIDTLDETGNAGIFADPAALIDTGQMYALLVANNSVIRFMTMEELAEGVNNEFFRWLNDQTPEVPEDHVRIISWKPRLTKMGKQMADIVYLDDIGNMHAAMVWPNTYNKVRPYCLEGSVVKLDIKETEDGAIFVDGIIR